MIMFVVMATIIIGLCLFVFTMSNIGKNKKEINLLIKQSGLSAGRKFKKVRVENFSVIINNHLNPLFETLPDYEKDNVLENFGISAIYTYSIGDTQYTSTNVSIVNSLDNIAELERIAQSKEKYCYVTGKNNNVSFLVKPDIELINREKNKRFIKEVPKLVGSVLFILTGLAMMVV